MKNNYSTEKATQYWNQRVIEKKSLEAVLTYNAPEALNKYYDLWERESLCSLLPEKLSGKRILDIATGVGRISIELAKRQGLVTAIDIAPNMLKQLSRKAKRNGLAEYVEPKLMPSHEIDKLPGKFDNIICFGLLEHLPPKFRRKTIEQAFSRLKKNGKMFVVINNKACPYLRGRYLNSKTQRRGHYVAVVGLPWLKKIALENNMNWSIVAANPFYAFLHYQMYLENKSMFSDQLLKLFTSKLLLEDLNLNLKNHELVKNASHFMIKIRHA